MEGARRGRVREGRRYPRGSGCAMWIVALALLPAAVLTLVVVAWTVLVWLGISG